MTIGTVKWYNSQKGYGNLREGQRVSFEVRHGNRGRISAVKLRQG